MADQTQEGTSLILYIGMLGMFFLALAIVGFVIIYKRRLLKQQVKLQEQKIIHQQQLLQSAVKIQDDERKRFAADLHDEIGGGISTILLSVERIKNAQVDQPEMVSKSQHIRDQLNDLLQKVREISYNIMPPTLEDFGLHEAISDLCYSISESSDKKVHYEWKGDEERLDFSQELAFYRIIKELLVNAVKHSEANTISITIENLAESFQLMLQDNGKGFDEEKQQKGAGLRNIKDRALILGATLHISSKIQQGTTVHIQLNK
ncbi:signal transduction histidine-protein kinase/phosphatase DegS [Kordia sp. SMS9]|uniref:sensor histidine kinase n=1 Tax=Kordia sp. SMS9 TaxID=2282170 RepID=UPI000E0D2C0F|nr:sensor histidine kinase [Kordia sp. SMS9]AXG71036.1 signal transduction histidine-protein kinase/phosphatase DegS [Kordia sp. SMS9]